MQEFIFWINTPAKKLILHLNGKTHHQEGKYVLKVYHMESLHTYIGAFGPHLYTKLGAKWYTTTNAVTDNEPNEP